MLDLSTQIAGPFVAIGDIHGQTEELYSLLERIKRTPGFEERWIVFLGDFVDRGPDPKGTIDQVLDLVHRHPKTTAVCGNHELAMLGALGWVPTPDYCQWKDRWLEQYQSETTFASYGVPFGDIEQLAVRIPLSHREFLTNLPWIVEHERYVFVHAGLDSNIPSNVQLEILRRRDFTLNRPPWLCSRTLALAGAPKDFKKTIVSGHVHVPGVQFQKLRVRVDTSGGLGGDLSGVFIPEKYVVTSAGSERRKCA